MDKLEHATRKGGFQTTLLIFTFWVLLEEQMKQIPLSQGEFALVDDEDYDWLSQWKWHAHTTPVNRSYYAIRNLRLGVNKRTTLRMHIEIMKRHGLHIQGLHVDHIDRNDLNNQKSNLRMCSQFQNNCNVSLRKDNSSGFKGVNWHKGKKKWVARIQVRGERLSVANSDSLVEAIRAYNEAAKKYHGEFAYLNEA